MICFRAGLLFGGTWTGVRNGLTATLWNSVTCKILHLGANNPTQYYRLGPGWRERSLTDKYLKVLMKKTENESSVHLWNTDKNWQPGCISRSVLIRSRKAILLCSCETTSQAHVKDEILHLNHFNYSKLTSSRCAIFASGKWLFQYLQNFINVFIVVINYSQTSPDYQTVITDKPNFHHEQSD